METARRWYKWFSLLYDPLMGVVEGPHFTEWRKLLWSKIEGRRILEVGVGTGRNFPFYPQTGRIVAIDFSESMLKRARQKALQQNIRVQLEVMDIQQTAFADASFDTVVSALSFCEVRDPVKGIEEIRRVVRSGGKVVMLEHIISDNQCQAGLLRLINPPVAALTGENFTRDTVLNVEKSGLIIENVTRLDSIFRLIEARKK
jgi:phosphatidylethanolamine/phosphatidyl-N-methylethanolamine N-methyltransferase